MKLPVLLLLGLSACTQTVRFPPDLWGWEEDTGWWDTGRDSATDTDPDTSGPNGPARIAEATLEWGCNPTKVAWLGGLRTTAWAGGASLTSYGPGSRVEHHPMLLTDSDAGGAWDEYQVGPLADGVSPDAWQPGTSSGFDCVEADALTLAVRLADRFDTLTDCVLWGADPAAASDLLDDPEVQQIGGCRLIAGP